jgi:hypothetical protein
MTRIFTQEKIEKYATTRLFGIDMIPQDVDTIWLYNGFFPETKFSNKYYTKLHQRCIDEFKKETGKDFSHFKKIIQKNEREPIFYFNGIICATQYSGFAREKRYKRMIEEFTSLEDIAIDFETFPKDKARIRQKNIDYDNFAYDFTVGLFVPTEKYEDRRVFDKQDIKDISTILIGPTKVVKKQTKVIAKAKSPYLDAQIVEHDGNKILNIGYVYGDQAGIILDKMLREYFSLAESRQHDKKIDIYMFGRVGGLADTMKRHDLVYPNETIDEIDISCGHPNMHPMNNILAESKSPILNLNAATVLDETYELLQKAKDLGCVCVELETREAVESINTARNRYSNQKGPKMDVNFGFVGYVSDIPLKGDTVADELDSDKGEQDALKEILNHIKVK